MDTSKNRASASLQPAGTCHSLLGSQQGWHETAGWPPRGCGAEKKNIDEIGIIYIQTRHNHDYRTGTYFEKMFIVKNRVADPDIFCRIQKIFIGSGFKNSDLRDPAINRPDP